MIRSTLLSFAVLISAAAAAGEPVLKTEFIYESAPFPSCHASTIEETPAGLVTAWFGGTDEKDPDVGIWVSRLEGEKWSAPVEVANGVQYLKPDGTAHRHPTWNPVLFQPKQGPLQLYYKCGPNPDAWWGMMTTSTDHGKTWAIPHRLPEGIDGPVKNKPVQLPNGDIFSPCSTEHDGWRVHFERTSDLGKTWWRSGPVNDGKDISAIQPSILFTGGENLIALGRTRQSKIFQVASADMGRTWGEMTLTNLPNPSSGTDAVTLKDGRHLLIYNHCIRGGLTSSGSRSPLNLAISKDGITWQAALVLENEPKREFSYPAIIQTSDGMVHATWTWHRKKIKHAVIDPTKLQPQDMVNGEWPKP
jgi:predicted neuraminidase